MCGSNKPDETEKAHVADQSLPDNGAPGPHGVDATRWWCRAAAVKRAARHEPAAARPAFTCAVE